MPLRLLVLDQLRLRYRFQVRPYGAPQSWVPARRSTMRQLWAQRPRRRCCRRLSHQGKYGVRREELQTSTSTYAWRMASDGQTARGKRYSSVRYDARHQTRQNKRCCCRLPHGAPSYRRSRTNDTERASRRLRRAGNRYSRSLPSTVRLPVAGVALKPAVVVTVGAKPAITSGAVVGCATEDATTVGG